MLDISGTITSQKAWDLGIHPHPMQLQEYCGVKPFIGKLYIKAGNFNLANQPIVTTIQTDATGFFTNVKLQQGTYCGVTDAKLNYEYNGYGIQNANFMYTQFIQTPDVIFEVRNNNQFIQLHLDLRARNHALPLPC